MEFLICEQRQNNAGSWAAQEDGSWNGCWWEGTQECPSAVGGHTLNSSWSLHLYDFTSDFFPFIDDSQERMESWASKVACPCGFWPILMFLKLLHSKKTKIPVQLLSDSEKLPGTSRAPFIRWDLALNVINYGKKVDFLTVVIYKTEGPFHCAVIKDKDLKLNLCKGNKNTLKHTTRVTKNGLFWFFLFCNGKLPFAFFSITRTVINSSLFAKEKRKALTQLKVMPTATGAGCKLPSVTAIKKMVVQLWRCFAGLQQHHLTIERTDKTKNAANSHL